MYNELMVALYILAFVLFAYFWLYPKLELYDIHSLSYYDFMVSLTTLIVGWFLYGGEEILFSLYFADTTWYWYSIVVYFLIEIPFVLWYLKRHNIL